jgi:superoxide oxidase
MWKSVPHRYSSLTIALHWLMVILIAAVYSCMELREIFPKGSDPREAMKMWHFMLGLTVLGLVILRLVARFSTATPEILPAQTKPVLLMAKLMHLCLYVFMIVMPIAGWIILSAEGKPIPFFGFEMPALVRPDKHLAHQAEEVHELFATLGYVIIALHSVAALFHHYIKGDNTLTRMRPDRRK